MQSCIIFGAGEMSERHIIYDEQISFALTTENIFTCRDGMSEEGFFIGGQVTWYSINRFISDLRY